MSHIIHARLRSGEARIAAVIQHGADPIAEIECKKREAPPPIDWEARAIKAEAECERLRAEAAELQASTSEDCRAVMDDYDRWRGEAAEARRERDRTIALANAFARAAKRCWADAQTFDRITWLLVDRAHHGRLARDALAIGLAECELLRAALAIVAVEYAALMTDVEDVKCERQELAAIVRALPFKFDGATMCLVCGGEAPTDIDPGPDGEGYASDRHEAIGPIVHCETGSGAPCPLGLAREWTERNPR